jgi:hypothetical protein
MSRPSSAAPEKTRDARQGSRGQTLAEFGVTLPLLLVVLLGIFQVSYLIYQQYVALNLAREGANLILRISSFDDVEKAIQAAEGDSQFDSTTRLILSVVQLGPPGPNEMRPIITQRHAWGMPSGASALGDPLSALYGGSDKNYTAPDFNNTGIRAKHPLPSGLTIVKGQLVYVAEIYRKRRDIVLLPGAQLPDSLYSVAYF